MIFKLQRSLMFGPPRMLLYNEDRSIASEGPAPANLKSLFAGREKIYVDGELVWTAEWLAFSA